MENKHLRSMTTIAAVVLAALLLALVGTKPADAAFPGLNGRITYRFGEDIWTMNANGSDRMNLTPGPNGEGDTPAYSPDGTKIAFTRDGALWTMNSDGTDQRRLSETGGIGWAPDWSPDGMGLVFARTRFGDLAVIEANGTGETRLTTGDAAFDDVPAYSPDGRYIVYSNCTRDGSPGGASSCGLRKMRLDDSSQMALTSPPEGEYHFFADWQPRPAFYLDGSANTIRFGEFVRISGTLVRDGLPVISGRRLSLWEQPAGSFKDFAPVPGAETTSEDGSFAFEKVQPHANTNYQVRFTGDEKAGLEPAMTAIKPVDVQVLVLLGLWTETLTLGKSITISGKVSPAHPDDEITLTIARNGERVGRTSVTLDKDSRYSLAYEPSRVGEYSVVASFPRDADHAGNTSPTRTFSVGKLGGGMAWEILQRQRTANG